jgi:hypothetical protein
MPCRDFPGHQPPNAWDDEQPHSFAGSGASSRLATGVLGQPDQVDANAALLVPATARGVGCGQDAAGLILSNATRCAPFRSRRVWPPPVRVRPVRRP